MLSIWKRELQGYFHTSIGYVFMAVFLFLCSILFYMQILQQRSSDLLTFIGLMSYFWMLLSPVLTMRLLAGERVRKTDQLLLTSPVSLPGIVLGKYLAAVSVLLLTVAMTLFFVLIIAVYGAVYPGELMVGYLGFILEGCAFLAMDLYLSGRTRGTVSAALLAFGANFLVWLLDLLVDAVPIGTFSDLLSFFSLYGRNEPFLMGQLSFASIGFDLTFTAAFLALTIHHLDMARCRGV